MADEVHQQDGYNVVAHNLVTLHENLSAFTTIEVPGLLIRMDAREAKIYGQDVVELLSEARDVLVKKYEAQLEEPTTVEIFPQQKDFAIRTFGLPGGRWLSRGLLWAFDYGEQPSVANANPKQLEGGVVARVLSCGNTSKNEESNAALAQ